VTLKPEDGTDSLPSDWVAVKEYVPALWPAMAMETDPPLHAALPTVVPSRFK
jgi:hypothetical protein